jgi:demethylmenaquinone methyltransferase/2-methoxy-6-polyprenyl-1,4-benzoquinol methylase
MANPFFQPGEQRAERVKDLFARVAPRYDLLNDLQSFGLHRSWKKRMLKVARPQVGERALDLCCGTGDLALALAGQGLKVVGVDFSEAMLQQAARRLGKLTGCLAPEAVPQFIRADAQSVPLPDNSFQIVTIGYGLRNLADWQAGLLEMKRLACPGGRLLVLDFGKPDNAFWRGLYFSYLRLFVPLLGRIFCGDASAYAYILESLKHYPAQHGVASKMRQFGLAKVSIINLLGGVMTINYGQKTKD